MRKFFPHILLVLCVLFLTHTAFSQNESPLPCADLIMTESQKDHNREVPLSFKVEFKGERNSEKAPIYKWKISAGKIVNGQGTNQILVNASKTNVEKLTAIVHVKDTENNECSKFGYSHVFFHYEFEPTLFDTYSETQGCDKTILIAYANSFAQRLKGLPSSTKGVIITYRRQPETNKNICPGESIYKTGYDFVKKILIEKHKISPDRISLNPGRWREANEIEFWTVPKDSIQPTPDDHLIMHASSCPNLSVIGIEKITLAKQFVSFTAQLEDDGNDNSATDYKWKVSEGEIVEGQGTPSIKVDISQVISGETKATVEARSQDIEGCNRKATFTTLIIR